MMLRHLQGLVGHMTPDRGHSATLQRYGCLLPQCDRQGACLLHTNASLHHDVDSKSVALSSSTSVEPRVQSMISLITSDGRSSNVAIATAINSAGQTRHLMCMSRCTGGLQNAVQVAFAIGEDIRSWYSFLQLLRVHLGRSTSEWCAQFAVHSYLVVCHTTVSSSTRCSASIGRRACCAWQQRQWHAAMV